MSERDHQVDVPMNLMCSCGEPYKITPDSGMSPMSCPVCGSFVVHDDPDEANEDFGIIRRYWLEKGRRDYAGLGDQP